MANNDTAGNDTDPLLENLISPRINPPPALFSLPEHDDVDVAIPIPITSSELKDRSIHRIRSAPAMVAINDLTHPVDHVFQRSKSYSKSTVRQSVALLIVYLTAMSVATVVYGDQALKTLPGWLLAAIWLLVSTLAVALAFFHLIEARVSKRNREWTNRVLGENMSISQFFEADINSDGCVSKSEYIIYKLKQMEKITDKDIRLIADRFDKIDRTNIGKITLSDIFETSTNDLSTSTSV